MIYMYKQQVLQYNTTYLCSGRKKALKFWKLNINISSLSEQENNLT